MRWLRFTVHLLIGLMILVPLYHVFEADSEASMVGPLGFQTNLLLTTPVPPPAYDRLRFLDQVVITNYVVRPHDSMWGLHQKFFVDEDTIRSSNMEDATSMTPGKILKIPNHRGTLYQVKAGETLEDIRKKFAWGRKDPNAFMTTVLALNNYPLPDLQTEHFPMPADSFLFLPNTTIKYWALDIPIDFAGRLRISSGFGMRYHPLLHIRRPHDGWDLPRPYGSPVHAAQSGRVTFTGWMGGYGNLIILTHAIKGKNGYNIITTRYGHLSKILVVEGQRVHQGQLIGKVGSSGISTGPHLHFEIRDSSGRPVNPKNYTH